MMKADIFTCTLTERINICGMYVCGMYNIVYVVCMWKQNSVNNVITVRLEFNSKQIDWAQTSFICFRLCISLINC